MEISIKMDIKKSTHIVVDKAGLDTTNYIVTGYFYGDTEQNTFLKRVFPAFADKPKIAIVKDGSKIYLRTRIFRWRLA